MVGGGREREVGMEGQGRWREGEVGVGWGVLLKCVTSSWPVLSLCSD